jgi:TRAP-type C4-dicarboxylate transport system permease small subunit
MELIGKIDRALAKLEEIALALILVAMVVLAALQVLLRNIWNTAIDWGDTSLQNATVVIGLLGAAIATSEGRHITIDVFSRLFKGRSKLALRVAMGVFSVAICALLAKGGWTTYHVNYDQWLRNLPDGWTTTRLFWQEVGEGTFPLWLSQLPLAGGFALIGLHFALRLVRDTGALISGEPWEAAQSAGPEGDAALDELEAQAADEPDAGGAGRAARRSAREEGPP